MENDTHDSTMRPASGVDDRLTALLRRGVRDLLKQVVEEELEAFLADHADYRVAGGRQAIVRNG